MGKEYFQYEKDSAKRIGFITFSRPEKLNMILASQEGGYFKDLLWEIEQDDDVKVLVLKGAGSCLGVGDDVTDLGTETMGFSRDPKEPPPPLRERLARERKMGHLAVDKWGMVSLFSFGKPVICQAHGYSYGWHFQIATESDIIIASDDALFTHPAFRYIAETFPAMAWMNTIGYQKTAEMLFTGRPFTAQELYEAGLVNRVVPREKLEDEVMEYALAIAKLPLDIIVVQKHYLQTLKAIRHDNMAGDLIACFGHVISTFMKPEPGDYLVLKEVTRKGPKGAIQAREDRYPPRWRLSHKGRAAKE